MGYQGTPKILLMDRLTRLMAQLTWDAERIKRMAAGRVSSDCPDTVRGPQFDVTCVLLDSKRRKSTVDQASSSARPAGRPALRRYSNYYATMYYKIILTSRKYIASCATACTQKGPIASKRVVGFGDIRRSSLADVIRTLVNLSPWYGTLSKPVISPAEKPKHANISCTATTLRQQNTSFFGAIYLNWSLNWSLAKWHDQDKCLIRKNQRSI